MKRSHTGLLLLVLVCFAAVALPMLAISLDTSRSRSGVTSLLKPENAAAGAPKAKAAEKAAQDARIKKREEELLRLSGEVEILNKGRDFIGKRRL